MPAARIRPRPAFTSGDGAPPDVWLAPPPELNSKNEPLELYEVAALACGAGELPPPGVGEGDPTRRPPPDSSPFHPPARALPFPAWAGLHRQITNPAAYILPKQFILSHQNYMPIGLLMAI